MKLNQTPFDYWTCLESRKYHQLQSHIPSPATKTFRKNFNVSSPNQKFPMQKNLLRKRKQNHLAAVLPYLKLKHIKRLFYISRLMEHAPATNTCTCINNSETPPRNASFLLCFTLSIDIFCYTYWFISEWGGKERNGLGNLSQAC